MSILVLTSESGAVAGYKLAKLSISPLNSCYLFLLIARFVNSSLIVRYLTSQAIFFSVKVPIIGSDFLSGNSILGYLNVVPCITLMTSLSKVDNASTIFALLPLLKLTRKLLNL